MKLYQNKYPVPDKAKYVVDYVCDGEGDFNYYYQIVRIKDNAILYANKDKYNIICECWKRGLKFEEVAFI